VFPRHCANVSSAFARLSPTPIAQRRTQVALRGTAPPSSSCFVQENQDARYLPECVEGVFTLKLSEKGYEPPLTVNLGGVGRPKWVEKYRSGAS
jgi:hypothetical protein